MRQGIVNLLKRVSATLGDVRDQEIAKRLGVKKEMPAKCRSGRQPMDAASARAIAEILGEDPDRLELQVAAECATDPMVRASYLRILNGPV